MSPEGAKDKLRHKLGRGVPATPLCLPLPDRKRFNRLSQEAGRNLFAIQTITFGPFVRIIVGSENFIDPRKVDRKVLVDPFFLGCVVPMMISRHHQIPLDPLRIRTKIAMSPRSVEGHKDQIGEDDRLRKSKHERDEDKSAYQCVIDKVRS